MAQPKYSPFFSRVLSVERLDGTAVELNLSCGHHLVIIPTDATISSAFQWCSKCEKAAVNTRKLEATLCR